MLEQAGAGGGATAQECGWLKDKYGASWQVVPPMLPELFEDGGSANAQRAMNAVLQMKKLDIKELKRAYAG